MTEFDLMWTGKAIQELKKETYIKALDDFLEECFARECDKSLSIAQLQSIKEELQEKEEMIYQIMLRC